MTTNLTSEAAFGEIEQRIWAWFVGVGSMLTLLGTIAIINQFAATIAATYLVGSLMFAGGLLMLLHAFGTRRRGWAVWRGFSGVLYLVAAACVLYDPLFAARILTLFLVFMLAAAGALRLIIALVDRGPGWGWMLASGIVSLAAAAVIALGWPLNAFWLPGLVLAIDLMFQGTMMMVIGFALHSANRARR